jgi:3',5'-cyclic AMP phosphodiesterase CpdA
MKAKILVLALTTMIAGACTDTVDPSVHELNLAVVSDIHYMDPSLLSNGAENGIAFQDYLNADPKLIQYSDAITKDVVARLLAEKPALLLIPGDLTKDGELVSHQSLVALLQPLRTAGIRVLVVPGNHDINNPEAAAYDGDVATPTSSISALDFATLYDDFGYGDALYRDPNSLSYVIAAPHPNLWILAIDDNKYADNTTIAIVGGNIKDATHEWILQRLEEAKQKGIRVFAMMHHGMVEHFASQNDLDPGYVTDNWEIHATAFMDAGLEVIFTGHYHANDITSYTNDNKALYDVETGSQSNPPLPYRVGTFEGKTLKIESRYTTTISTALPGGLDLVTYSNAFFSAHLDGAFSYLLTQPPFSLPDADAAASAPQFRNAYMAHFAGDEAITGPEQALDDAIALMSPMAGMALATLWADLNTPDNTVTITLK